MTTKQLVEKFLTTNQDARIKNKGVHYNRHDNQMLLRYYETLIATRIGDNVEITSTDHSKSTKAILNLVRRGAEDLYYKVEYVDKFCCGGKMVYGGGLALPDTDTEELRTFKVQIISDLGEDMYEVEESDGVQAFHQAKYLFKKENPTYKGDLTLAMVDSYGGGGVLGTFNYSIGGL